jgi:hypothetical protein
MDLEGLSVGPQMASSSSKMITLSEVYMSQVITTSRLRPRTSDKFSNSCPAPEEDFQSIAEDSMLTEDPVAMFRRKNPTHLLEQGATQLLVAEIVVAQEAETHSVDDHDSFTEMDDTEALSFVAQEPNAALDDQQFQGNYIIHGNDFRYDVTCSREFRSYARMYNLLNSCKVPLYAYDQIVSTIGMEVSLNNFDPKMMPYSRLTFLKEIKKRFKTASPLVVPVHLENKWNETDDTAAGGIRDTVEVVVFDFKEQLEDLISDYSLFGDIDNLVVNKEDDDSERKWEPYDRIGDTVYEVLDGKWYQDYARIQVTDSSKEFSFPIGLYIDASETVTYQRYSFQPLLMFPLVLNCKARNRITSSRILALIPDLDAKSSAVKNATRAGGDFYKGTAIRNYHQCMDAALSSLKKWQRMGGVLTYLRLGSDVRKRLLKVPVAMILGDAKSQDHLCGRFGAHNTKRMCRACNVSFEESANAEHHCTWVWHDQFDEQIHVALNVQGNETNASRKEAYALLNDASQHAVINAFRDIDFASFPRGIFGCTPHDLMHCFLEGVLKYCTRLFIQRFTDKQKACIDQFVDHIFGNFRSNEKKNMPRTSFIKGMTNLTMITADEEVGIALTLLIIAQTDKGRELLSHGLRKSDDDAVDSDDEAEEDNNRNEDEITRCSYRSFVELLEMLLSFHSWYKSEVGIRWNNASRDAVHRSVITMINKVKTVLPRNTGYSWKLQKFHELLHIPIDVENFGSPKNFDTGIMENRLIHVGKINAKHTQKRGCKIFTRQLANRIHESQSFYKTKRCLNMANADATAQIQGHLTIDDNGFNKQQCDYVVHRSNNGVVSCRWKTRTNTNVPEIILQGIADVMLDIGLDTLEVYTEVAHLGRQYRAHPNYRGTGAWYDWAMIRFVQSDTDRDRHRDNLQRGVIASHPPGFYPSKLLAFYKINTDIHCLFQCTESKISSEDDSCLTERWNLEYAEYIPFGQRRPRPYLCPKLRYCHISCVETSVYVVQENPGLLEQMENDNSVVVLVKKKPTWKMYFTDS